MLYHVCLAATPFECLHLKQAMGVACLAACLAATPIACLRCEHSKGVAAKQCIRRGSNFYFFTDLYCACIGQMPGLLFGL